MNNKYNQTNEIFYFKIVIPTNVVSVCEILGCVKTVGCYDLSIGIGGANRAWFIEYANVYNNAPDGREGRPKSASDFPPVAMAKPTECKERLN